ncbi:hypothetical protein ABTY20_17180 [Streptomyces sp. NPDC126497]|uniref:hypothetical protein n=1 Tax=Streptomyces sp. NPDC126497 TaxID=3155313 RepID=UPI00331C6D10
MLDESVGYTQRKKSSGELSCSTKAVETRPCDASGDGRDAGLSLHASAAARDDHLRLLLSDDYTPHHLVTAGNWTIQFCDTATGQKAARQLGGALVEHTPGKR